MPMLLVLRPAFVQRGSKFVPAGRSLRLFHSLGELLTIAVNKRRTSSKLEMMNERQNLYQFCAASSYLQLYTMTPI